MELAEPRITTIAEIKLVGISRKMSFAGNQAAGLRKSFMPRLRKKKSGSLWGLAAVQITDENVPSCVQSSHLRADTRY